MDVAVGVQRVLPYPSLSPQAAHQNHSGALNKPDARLCPPKTNDISRVFLKVESYASMQKSPSGCPQGWSPAHRKFMHTHGTLQIWPDTQSPMPGALGPLADNPSLGISPNS